MISGAVPVWVGKGVVRGCLSSLGCGDCGMPGRPAASLGMGSCRVLPLAQEGVGSDVRVPPSIGGWGCLNSLHRFQPRVLPSPDPVPLGEEWGMTLG